MTGATVFVSYSRRDAALGERFQNALKRLGLKTFSSEVPSGEDWRQTIQSAIEQSDMVVALVSTPEILSSSWTPYYAGMAEALGKPVLLLLPNKYSVADLPEEFASYRIVKLDPQAPERAAQDIASRLAVVN
jgi:hypothetical protein